MQFQNDKGKCIIYVDTGGTFSDAVIVDEKGSFVCGKAATTPNALDDCFFNCIQDASRKKGSSVCEVFSHTAVIGFGTTAGTNALITRMGIPKLGLITTRGFEDTTLIMRHEGRWQGLPMQEGLHIAGSEKPEPLIPRELIKGVTERIDFEGSVIIPLYEEDALEAVQELLKAGVEGIAVALLWSFLNDVHEKKIKEIIENLSPGMPVSLSCEVAPIIREYPRFNSTIINLYVAKPLRSLLSNIGNRLQNFGYGKELLVMQSSGGLSRCSVLRPITTLHSGPVGGLVGVEFMKGLYGEKIAMGTDMGGTSFDLCISKETGAEYIKTPVVGRFTLANPMLGVEAIGAGGGTLAYIDQVTGQLRMGPESAGAVPGPVCYDKGGCQPTVTDADVVLNRIDASFFLDGQMKLDKQKAAKAIEVKITKPLKLDSVEEAALGICTAIDGIMSSAIRTFLNTKGVDPRDTLLFVYGGAGPTHCAGYSKGLGFKKILIPPFAAVFSAFGASTAEVIHRYEASPYLIMPHLGVDIARQRFSVAALKEIDPSLVLRFNDTFGRLEEKALKDMRNEGFDQHQVSIKYWLDMRFGGQLHEVSFVSPVGRIKSAKDLASILRTFENEYIRLYGEGTLCPKGGAEIITVSLEVSAPSKKPIIARQEFTGEDSSGARKGKRKVYFKGGWRETPIYAIAKLRCGNLVMGPAIIEGNDTTVVLPEEFEIEVDEYLNLELRERG